MPIYKFDADKPTVKFTIESPDKLMVFPITGNFNPKAIKWGDGGFSDTISSWSGIEKRHEYDATGTYTITTSQIGPENLDLLNIFWRDKLTKIEGILKPFVLLDGTTFRGDLWPLYGLSKLQSLINIDVSNMTNMASMFYNTTTFNHDIGSWDVSNVTGMSNMFNGANAFNQDLNAWDVSNVTSMFQMFYNNGGFNNGGVALTGWDTSGVTDMYRMFCNADAFNQDISSWDVSNVTTMFQMFSSNGGFNNGGVALTGWDTSSVTDMYQMFYNATGFNQDIGSWDVSNVTNISNMLKGATSFNNNGQPLNWNVSSCTSFSEFLPDAAMPLITGTGFIFGNHMKNLFNSRSTLDVSGWNWTTKPTGVNNLDSFAFSNSTFNPTWITGWDMSNVTSMASMFNSATAFNQDIGSWDVSNVTGMSNMFYNADAFNQDLNAWDVSNVTDMFKMFYNNDGFTNGGVDFTGWDISSTIRMGDIFGGTCGYTGTGFLNWKWGKTLDYFFINPSMKSLINDPVVTGFVLGLTGIENMNSMFQAITGNPSWISQLDTSSCNDVAYMFKNATAFNQDIGSWDVSNVTTMFQMFYYAPAFNQDLNAWDVSNVTDMSDMFIFNGGFNNGGVALTGWNTSSVTEMLFMFYDATAFNQDIGSWDVSNVTDMTYMFANAENFNNGGSSSISGWNTGKVKDMSWMFSEAGGDPGVMSFNQPIGTWDVSSVETMESMFDYYSFSHPFNQDVSQWNMSGVKNISWWASNNFNNGGMPLTGWNLYSMEDPFYCFYFSNFNQSVSGWKLGPNCDYWGEMFWSTPFNQEIAGWDVSEANNVAGILYNANSFSSPFQATGWDVRHIESFFGIFGGNAYTRLDFTGWDFGASIYGLFCLAEQMSLTGAVVEAWATGLTGLQDVRSLFSSNTTFNSSWITGLDVSNVTNMSNMFENADAFNQDLNVWDVSNVTSMRQMFRNNGGFNNGGVALTGWDTSSVTDMQQMFNNADAFDQDLSSFIITGVTIMDQFMQNAVGLSTTNYDRTLSGWASQVHNQAAGATGSVGISIHFGGSKYSVATGQQYRDTLIAAGWTITDGGSI